MGGWLAMGRAFGFFFAMAALSGLGVGCGGGSGSSTTSVTGTVEGQSYSANGGLSCTGALGDGFLGTSTVVFLMDPTASATPPTGPQLTLALATVVNGGGDSKPITMPGTYQVVQGSTNQQWSAGSYAVALFDDCQTSTPPATPITKEAASGTVTVDAIDASHVAGSIDLTFGEDRIAGSFDATVDNDFVLCSLTPSPVCE
jgi:hypothetical protein